MIAYFDTSALVPLVVEERGSAGAAALWVEADRVVSARLVYVEGRAALAQAHRLGRLTSHQFRASVKRFEALHDELDVVDIDNDLVRTAGHLAELHSLRGYDAVHLAAAIQLRDSELVVVADDSALLGAASAEHIATADLNIG